MGERTTVIGTILAVVFQNEENGYTVARIVTDDGEPVTVVGWYSSSLASRRAQALGAGGASGALWTRLSTRSIRWSFHCRR